MSEKRILITGGAGFIGSYLVDCLKKEDSRSPVMIIDNCSRTLAENRQRIRKAKTYLGRKPNIYLATEISHVWQRLNP